HLRRVCRPQWYREACLSTRRNDCKRRPAASWAYDRDNVSAACDLIGPYVRAHVLGWEEHWSVRARPLIFRLLIGLTLPTLPVIYPCPHSAADDRIICGKLEDGLDIG